MNRKVVWCYLAIFSCYFTNINAQETPQHQSQFKAWHPTMAAKPLTEASAKFSESLVTSSIDDIANTATTFTTEPEQLRTVLLNNEGSITLSLPLPNGELVDFILTPSGIMAPDLATKYSQIKTYTGVEVNNPAHHGRFDITPNGFHSMFLYQGQWIFIEPETALVAAITDSNNHSKAAKSSTLVRDFSQQGSYSSYIGKKTQLTERGDYQFHPPKQSRGLYNEMDNAISAETVETSGKSAKSSPSQSAIKTYRLAISAAAEYTAYNGGTVDSAMAEIITLVNRLNEVYQRDLAVKLELVADNDQLIFTNSSTDPFENNSDDGDLNTDVIDGIIGNINYDIGHIVSTRGGGLAVLGAVCSTFNKGNGVTGANRPNNDSFYIDYVAHEIGHQFGANHSFNGTKSGCSGNRIGNAAYEVGSGSTIMGYAGLCGNENLQGSSDAYFHSKSIETITDFIITGNGRRCGTTASAVNNTAIVDAGNDYTIPAHTPFELIGSATDEDNDVLTYSWEQIDLGTESSSNAEHIDDGSRPLFRAWSPVSTSNRVLPKLDDVLANTSSIGEVLPTTDRTINFRLLVRDDQGGVSYDDNVLTVVNTGEAFAVNSPLSSDTWVSNQQAISWQVAQTDTSPISCASVDISLSTDGGNTFEHNLASDITNSGNANISLAPFCDGSIDSANARVKVACSDNIFFAVNSGNFTVSKNTVADDIGITAQQALAIEQGESITLNTSMFSYRCQTPTSLVIVAGDNYTVSENTLTPNSDFFGTLSVSLRTQFGSDNSDVFIATITVTEFIEPEPTEPEPTEPEPEPISKVESSSSGSVFWLLASGLIVVIRRVRYVDTIFVKAVATTIAKVTVKESCND